MVIHPLVVISFNKISPSLKANAVESADLRASQFVLYLLSTSLYSHLPLHSSILLDIFDCCSVPGDVENYISGFDDFSAFVSQSMSLWHPALRVSLFRFRTP
jgi:hypothetical protein